MRLASRCAWLTCSPDLHAALLADQCHRVLRATCQHHSAQAGALFAAAGQVDSGWLPVVDKVTQAQLACIISTKTKDAASDRQC